MKIYYSIKVFNILILNFIILDSKFKKIYKIRYVRKRYDRELVEDI